MQGKTDLTSQYIDNLSFDDTYENATVELVGEDIGNSVLRRVQVDSAGNIITSTANYDTIVVDTTGADITVTKKMGSTTIDTKTIQII